MTVQDPEDPLAQHDVDPALLPWLPVSWRQWLLPPLLLVVLSLIVLLAARGSDARQHLDAGWRVAAVAGIAAAVAVTPFALSAYLAVSERAAVRYRRATAVIFLTLGVVLVVDGVLTDNTFLASSAIYLALPYAARFRPLLLAMAEQHPERAARIVTRVLVSTILVILLAVAAAAFGPGGFATSYVVSNVFVYGLVVAVGAAVTRREIGRLRSRA